MTVENALHVLVVDDDDADTLMIEEILLTMPAPPVLHRVRDGREAPSRIRPCPSERDGCGAVLSGRVRDGPLISGSGWGPADPPRERRPVYRKGVCLSL